MSLLAENRLVAARPPLYQFASVASVGWLPG